MHPTILNAYKKAQGIVEKLTNPPKEDTGLKAELEKLTKKELVQYILDLKKPSAKPVTKEELAYAILEDPDCAWLTFDVIAEIIKANITDANTSKACLSWYQSNAIKKGKNVVPRKSNKEIMALAFGEQK